MKYVPKLKVKTHDDRTTLRLKAGVKGTASIVDKHLCYPCFFSVSTRVLIEASPKSAEVP